MLNKIIFFLLCCAAVLLGILSYQHGQDEDPKRIDFVMNDLQGQQRSAIEFDGQLVLLNFWAPWCAPCRAEIPMLNELQETYGPRGLQILGPALDEVEAIQRFMQTTAIAYPVLVGMPTVMRLQYGYGEQRLPFSLLIDRSGNIIFRHAGELQKSQIAPLIEQNL